MELSAELRARDGRTWPLLVRCEPEPGPGSGPGSAELRGLRRGLEKLQEQLAELLAPLVQEEREAAGGAGPRAGDAAEEDEEDEDEEDEGDEDEGANHVDVKANAEDPPVKRTKVQQC